MAAQPNEIRISIDGATGETYEKIRVGAKFQTVIENVAALKRIRDDRKYRTAIVIHSVITGANLPEIARLKRELSQYCDEATVGYALSWGFEPAFESPVILGEPYACDQLWETMTIESDGSVGFCCNDFEEKGKIGNIHNSTVKEIWNSSDYKKVRSLHRKGQFEKIGLCQGCQMPSKSDQRTLQNFYQTLKGKG